MTNRTETFEKMVLRVAKASNPRIKDFVEVGPVQRAAIEEYTRAIAAELFKKPFSYCNGRKRSDALWSFGMTVNCTVPLYRKPEILNE